MVMEGSRRVRLGELLVNAQRLSQANLERALAVQAATRGGVRLGRVLEDLGYCGEEDIAHALSEQLDMPYIEPNALRPHQEALALLGAAFCREREIIPAESDSHYIHLAMADPLGIQLLDRARETLHDAVYPASTTRSAILRAIDAVCGTSDPLNLVVQEAQLEITTGDLADPAGLETTATSAPAVRLVNEIFARAAQEGASDIHIEPRGEVTEVRYRVDGALRTVLTLPRALHETVTARVKIMSDLNIMERRAPQDGHCDFRFGGDTVDVRVSTLPTTHGEKTVLRLLGAQRVVTRLEDLGIAPGQLELVRAAIRQPQGCVVVTGPTGSGKSSTLVACLQEIVSEALNITTIEDPVEREVEGVSHSQVNEVAGLTFASGLRSLLRQDPDVVMLGEIRDAETAEIAMRAALTGHLLLTTVHANHALAAVTRLRDIGTDDFLISAALTLVLAQRLSRRICPLCRQPYTPTQLERGILADALGRELTETIEEGRGCDHCGGRGYLGRIAVSETIPFTQELQTLVAAGKGEVELAAMAREQGAVWMFEDGVEKVVAGSTSLRELLRAVPIPRYRAKPEPLAAAQPARSAAEDAEVEDDARGPLLFPEAKPAADRSHLEAFVRQLTRLPMLPDVVLRLTKVIQDENAGAGDVAAVIETDQGLAAKVLRVANSAAYALRREVRSVPQAVAFLGLGQVWSTCVGAGVVDALSEFDSEVLPFEEIWTHSFGAAVCARELARAAAGIDEGQAYLAGLLHDVGKVLMGTYITHEFDQCVRSAGIAGTPLWQVEQTYLSFCHAEVGQWLLEEWRIPPEIALAVALHHYPPLADSPEHGAARSLALITALADDIVKSFGLGYSGDPTVFENRAPELAELGLTAAAAEAVGQTAARCVREIVEAMRP